MKSVLNTLFLVVFLSVPISSFAKPVNVKVNFLSATVISDGGDIGGGNWKIYCQVGTKSSKGVISYYTLFNNSYLGIATGKNVTLPNTVYIATVDSSATYLEVKCAVAEQDSGVWSVPFIGTLTHASTTGLLGIHELKLRVKNAVQGELAFVYQVVDPLSLWIPTFVGMYKAN